MLPENSIWEDVLKMDDAIDVEYGKLEELLAVSNPSTPTDTEKPANNKRASTHSLEVKETENHAS